MVGMETGKAEMCNVHAHACVHWMYLRTVTLYMYFFEDV